MRNKIWSWAKRFLPPVLWAGMIFALSSQSSLPGPQAGLADFIFKKSAHMFVYAVLYFLLHRACNYDQLTAKPSQPAKNWWLPFLICFAYAAIDELHQYFTPRRHPAIRDIGFDMLGSALAFLRIYRYL